jgi:hypothetical protein
VPGERTTLAEPLTIDLSHLMAPPLRFVVQPPYVPSGIVEHMDNGMTAVHSP